MKRLSLLLLGGLAMAAVAACPGKKPDTTPAPTGPNTDSIEAARRRIADSTQKAEADARAREAAERERQQRIADSPAATGHTTGAVKTMLATLTHFDYDKASIRARDPSRLHRTLATLRAN